MAVCHQYKTEKIISINHAILVSGFVPSALELAVLTILRPHFRIQDGASLVSAEGLEALATLSPRGLHVFPVVPYALATLRIASSQIGLAWIGREMRSSLVIDVEEWSVEPSARWAMMNVRSCSFLLTMMVNHVHNPNANAQWSSRSFADKMNIHRLNHKLSCMVRAKTDDSEQRRNFFKGH